MIARHKRNVRRRGPPHHVPLVEWYKGSRKTMYGD